jgi:glycosyltransferase involved in cell wall biosynthesis
VFLNRDLLEGKFSYEAALFERNPRVVFDFDDAIFLGEKAGHIGQICRRAAWVLVGNEYLAEFARQHSSRVSVIPTVIDTELYAAAPQLTPGQVRVGWLGSNQSIRETLWPHLYLLAELQSALGFEFVVMTRPRPDIPTSRLRWRFVEWSPAEETRIASHFDIGIMPLIDTPFQRGKCGCKILQYMSASLPVVASPVGINGDLLGNGDRGLAAHDAEGWREALSTLSASPDLRRAMGQRGHDFVAEHYSVNTWFPRWLSIIENVAASSPRR